eukprot:TRINITY_DN32040_c0_g1_i1.p1 TRINITY_DN32040_c0_g1~~TRINITY_DN32040_c0_g1_i1.p1  ORF type:complete len:430 (-),score=92.61 TRINITY_DN32040_c0_g1_i1:49-1338(-)
MSSADERTVADVSSPLLKSKDVDVDAVPSPPAVLEPQMMFAYGFSGTAPLVMHPWNYCGDGPMWDPGSASAVPACELSGGQEAMTGYLQFMPAMMFDTSGACSGTVLVPMSMGASPPFSMPGSWQMPNGCAAWEGWQGYMSPPTEECGSAEDCQQIAESTSAVLLQALLEGKDKDGRKKKLGRFNSAEKGGGEENREVDSCSGHTAVAKEDPAKALGLRLPEQLPMQPQKPGAIMRGTSGSSTSRSASTSLSSISTAATSPALANERRSTAEKASSLTSRAVTTVMLKNVPNKYSRSMLLEELNKHFKGLFDFLYLPIDFKNGCNIGYCFINWRTHEACGKFIAAFDGKDVNECLPGLQSKKVVEIRPARVQGLEENVKRLRNSPVMTELLEHPDWMPLLLDDDGQELPFPEPQHPLPPVKPRSKQSGH